MKKLFVSTISFFCFSSVFAQEDVKCPAIILGFGPARSEAVWTASDTTEDRIRYKLVRYLFMKSKVGSIAGISIV